MNKNTLKLHWLILLFGFSTSDSRGPYLRNEKTIFHKLLSINILEAILMKIYIYKVAIIKNIRVFSYFMNRTSHKTGEIYLFIFLFFQAIPI